jgi:hypothetical protein
VADPLHPLRGVVRVLSPVTHLPRHRSDERALLEVVKTMRRFNWERFLVGWCAAFHVATAVPLAFAPIEQILNAGTRPVFDMASRYVWAALFLVAALLSAYLLRNQSTVVQVATWLTVMPLGGLWLTAFALAVIDGRGSAIGLTVWPFLYGPWAVAGVRLALGKR